MDLISSLVRYGTGRQAMGPCNTQHKTKLSAEAAGNVVQHGSIEQGQTAIQLAISTFNTQYVAMYNNEGIGPCCTVRYIDIVFDAKALTIRGSLLITNSEVSRLY